MKHAIILCAGSARRFFPEGYPDGVPQPKCLLPLTADETILDRLLRQVRAHGYEAVLGTGCGNELVEVHAARYEGVRCIYNPQYETTNSIVTLWQMREIVTDSTLLINGDLVVDDAVLGLFHDTATPQLLVKHLALFDDDTYRVVFDEDSNIVRMGKEISDPPSPNCAAFLGISRVGNAAAFLTEIEKLLESGSDQTWPTTAYRNLISHIPVRAVNIGSTPFFDVDTLEEYEAARNSSLIARRSSLP
jgi:2-aminoethylphosphonate-pyruvate transaminase